MLNGLRKLYRSALDTELGVVGGEILQLQSALEALIERYHRLQARIGMRALRAGKAGGDGQLMMELQAAAANDADKKKGNGEWPDAA